jgi:hypothetical protein
MADGDFTTNHKLLGEKNGSQHDVTTNHKLLGKKNGSQHDDRNDKLFSPEVGLPTWNHFLPHF